MPRQLAWISHERLSGWACSDCGWTFPVPPLLTAAQEANSAYNRLAYAKFQEHECDKYGQPQSLASSEDFAARTRRLVMRGFKPKDAVDVTLQEIRLECRNNPSAIKRAEEDADNFLLRVKQGFI